MRTFIVLGVASFLVTGCSSGGSPGSVVAAALDGGAPAVGNPPPSSNAPPAAAASGAAPSVQAGVDRGLGPGPAATDPGTAAAADGGAATTPAADAGSDGGIACGSATCDPNTQYCRLQSSGGGLPDSGLTSTFTNNECAQIPGECMPSPTCGCIGQIAGCSCSDDAGALATRCIFPGDGGP